MNQKTFVGLILLTYKGKALLMHKQNSVIDEEKHPWCFISADKNGHESHEKAMAKNVQRETGIKIENIEILSQSYYHARLTDDNVNKIKRAEHQLLDFYALKDIKNLYLSNSTKDFVSKYGDIIENAPFE